MQNKVYTIQGIRVITVPDGDAFGCTLCVFDKSEEGCKGTLDGDDSCARKHFHYEKVPTKILPSNTHAINEDEIYHLTHGDNKVVSVGDNSFDIQCLHETIVLFHFDHCCGEYIYIRSFNKTEKGVAACVAAIEEQVKILED
jgi:hypothetical protein